MAQTGNGKIARWCQSDHYFYLQVEKTNRDVFRHPTGQTPTTDDRNGLPLRANSDAPDEEQFRLTRINGLQLIEDIEEITVFEDEATADAAEAGSSHLGLPFAVSLSDRGHIASPL